MVNKKTHKKEEPGKETHNETTDNKGNNVSQESAEEKSLNNQDVIDKIPQEGEAPAKEVSSSDKVVAAEKTMEEKLAEMQDKYIRLSAEFDNYRKRTLREKIELSKYASENLLLEILPVMDDFERALSHMESASDCAAMKDGIDLIYVKFTEFLKLNGIREIESFNCVFNVDLHDAVAKIPVEEEEKKGRIVEVIQKGYYLQNKVIRHSKVVVGE
jgi:molecular chaperone GrpE